MDSADSIHAELPTDPADDRPKPGSPRLGAADPLLVDQQPQLVDSDAEPSKRRPTKRKHSPAVLAPPTPPTATSSHAASPAPNTTTAGGGGGDPSDISNPPVLVPHALHLPDSEFEFYSTRSHPFNKHGYRYTPCGPSLGTPLPVPPQRTIESFPKGVHWSWEDRSQFTVLTEDARTITTDKGWRAARANVGIREGAWYWEIKIERGGGDGGRDKGGEGQGSWVRPGVGRRESPLNAPVGIDGYSYGYRDRTGDAVSLAQPAAFGQPYGTSAVIGVYVSLPPRPPLDTPSDRRSPARIVRKRIPIRYRGSLYFEQLEYAPSKEMDELLVDPALEAFRKRQHEEKLAKAKATAPGTKAPPSTEESGPPLRPLPKLEGSQVAFFLDGECQGVAFEDLYDFLPLRKIKNPGTNTTTRERSKKDSRALMENWHDDGATGYFPMVSVFGGGIATLNPGPSFDFPPPSGDLDPVLAQSPHPPTKPRVKMPGADGGGHWRPLCERYDEFVKEQAYLDDLDAQEAVRVLLEAKQDALRAAAAAAGAGASLGISSGGGGAALATTASGTATPTSKKARIATEVSLAQATTAAVTAAAAASNRLAALGVVKAESGAAAAQTESPAQSPSPLPPPPPTSAALPSFSSSSAAAT
ncbi:hypothetical protein B0A53_01346 [Rhodotorula sp. CCFEE 5036]|nr:hypothetical protein B0A53_01346 [Rhodotorula sp. CCFEE 5036]